MIFFDPLVSPPENLSIEITTECNLRCKHCHLWMSKEDKNTLLTHEKLDLVMQFQAMNPKGFVTLTGGETMSKTEEFFAITKLCRSLNLETAAVTNSSLISDINLERMLIEGPLVLFISLDSHLEKIHDYVRGVKGAYKHVTSTLKKLVECRRNKYPDSNTKIFTNSVIFDENLDYWDDYIDFARNELGVDGVSFQMLSNTFFNQNKKGDHFFEKHFIKDVRKAHMIIDGILTKYHNDKFVLISQNDLEWMKSYIENPNFVGEQVCGSHKKNLIVNQDGDVQLCFNMMSELTNDKPLGNVRESSLKALWSSQFAGEMREVMSGCSLSCGMLSCHRMPTPDIASSWEFSSRRYLHQLLS